MKGFLFFRDSADETAETFVVRRRRRGSSGFSSEPGPEPLPEANAGHCAVGLRGWPGAEGQAVLKRCYHDFPFHLLTPKY